jgi:GGDEF domain-containing protein/EAL domain-containing protein (putative c-di-GMP-specific phosphodiesterase class I)
MEWLSVRALAAWWGTRRAQGPALDAASPGPLDSLRQAYAAQTEQLQRLQRQVQLDAVSGLPLRLHFLAQLAQRLAEPGAPAMSLLLVRVAHLEALNERLGFEATDRLLAAVGDVLMTYVDLVPRTFCGRLNGSDFALCLPVAGLADETASSLRAALAAAPSLRMGMVEVVVGGVDDVRNTTASGALAGADAALARAEAGMHEAAVLALSQAGGAGARAWREQIGAALSEARVQLEERPCFDARGVEQQLACRLQLQLGRGGAFEPPEQWQPLARRSRLLPQADLAAVSLALRAIARDGRTRAVPVAASSCSTPGFVADLAALLASAPAAAQRLRIEAAETQPTAAAAAALLGAPAVVWRPLGVNLGAALAVLDGQRLAVLAAAGITQLTLDLPSHDDDAQVCAQLRAFVEAAHGLDLRVLALGVNDAQSLARVWALGFDAAGGAALESPPTR